MIKTLSACIKEFKRDSLLAPFFVVLEVIMEVIIPFLMTKIIDNGVNNGNIKYVCCLGIFMAFIAFLSLCFGALAGKYAASASTGFCRNVRKAMFDNIQNFSFSNIDKFSTAGLVTRLTIDVTNLQNAYQMIIRMCTRAPIMLIAAMFMAFSINMELSLVYVAAIIFLSLVLGFVISRAFPAFKQVFKKYDDLNASVQENITAIRVVKAYVRENYEIDKFNSANTGLYNLFIRAENLVILNMPVMMFTMYFCILLISWLGAGKIFNAELTTGELMSMFTYIMNILMSLMMISMVFVMITMAKSSAERVAEVINEKSDLKNTLSPIMNIKDGSVEFKNVSFKYKEKSENFVLKDISFKINSGETIGIIGATGSAKSSLVNLIPRLYDVNEGEVTVGGINVKDYDLQALRNSVSMVLQKNILFSGSIKDNLRWGDKNADEEQMLKVCRLAQADSFIQSFSDKYDTFIEQGGSNVSGGQKQRLCIARALLKKPKILILDDSTSAVDTKTDSLIRKAFKEEIPDTTKIIISQRISSVQDADKIIVLNDGKIEAMGTHDELLKINEIYREIYLSQTKGGDDNEK